MTATVGAFALAAVVFAILLVAASLAVTFTSSEWIKPTRMIGGGVRRWSGYVLIAVGLWFLFLAFLPSPVFV